MSFVLPQSIKESIDFVYFLFDGPYPLSHVPEITTPVHHSSILTGLKWHYVQLRINGITAYFVTSVHKMILNIVSTTLWHKNINKHKDRGAFDIRRIKSVGSLFYILTIFII